MTSNTGAGQSPHIAAIEAARRTFIAALRKRDDAFADVQQHCPTAVSLWQYDETHETYLAVQARGRSEQGRETELPRRVRKRRQQRGGGRRRGSSLDGAHARVQR